MSYISRMRSDTEQRFSFVELIGEWTISGFAGLITAYICIDAGMSWELTAVATGMAGHMGGRAVFIIESLIKSKVGN